MKKFFNARYDNEATFDLYLIYKDSGEVYDLNNLLILLCPLIRYVSKRFTLLETYDQDHIEAESLEKLFTVVSGKRLPSLPVDFERFLKRVLYNTMISSLRSWKSHQHFDFGSVCSEPLTGSLPSHGGVEARLYREQLVKFVRSFVRSKLPCRGVERKACIFILDSLLNLQRTKSSLASSIFSLSRVRTEYLTQKVSILVRWGFNSHRELEQSEQC